MAGADPGQALSEELVLKRLERSSESEFSDLSRLYIEAFPENERKPLSTLHQMLATEGYSFFLAVVNEAVVGFAIVRALSGDALLLEYMAVAQDQRRRGFGKRIVLAISEAVHAPQKTLLLEVESDHVESPDRALRTRRKSFYRSLGAKEIANLSWVMPPVMSTPPPPMEMLAFAGAASVISRDQVRQWLSSIYVHVYGQRGNDPRIHTMLANLPEKVLLV